MRVCVPVCAKNVAEMAEACRRASEVADVIELRLDCLEDSDFEIETFVKKLSHPIILTFRPVEQGGYRALGRPEREAFWNTDLKANLLCDIEADLVLTNSFDWPRVIVSHHDFNGVPDDLEEIYERLAATPARVVKIAVKAKDITDCIRVFRLLERAQSEQRELIAIAMGNAGIATRVLGPSRGAYLTYGSLEDESATAPGQVNARALRSVYRIDEIDRETMICGLVGMPVMHSVSPHMHNAAFAAAGLNGVYLPLEVRELESFVRRMIHPKTRELDWNVRGLSITAPHKSSVMELLDWIEPDAQEIGAVNTIVVEDHELHGYNTDVHGLIEPLRERVGLLDGLRVAVIGAGGAARAAVWALSKDGARVTLFARDAIKGGLLAEAFGVSCEALSGASFRGYDVVINATPECPATAEQLAGAGVGYDLIYNPIETGFLKEARAAGCQTLGGLPMLVAQACLQSELWTGKTPPAEVMHDAAIAALGRAL
ncbi:MAG TPA: shikimate dehydrogenase [Pyrinomonadaceae bacterium]|nr:shikimate dehydrogenase [Pyrinomonadaceae bacterium]